MVKGGRLATTPMIPRLFNMIKLRSRLSNDFLDFLKLTMFPSSRKPDCTWVAQSDVGGHLMSPDKERKKQTQCCCSDGDSLVKVAEWDEYFKQPGHIVFLVGEPQRVTPLKSTLVPFLSVDVIQCDSSGGLTEVWQQDIASNDIDQSSVKSCSSKRRNNTNPNPRLKGET